MRLLSPPPCFLSSDEHLIFQIPSPSTLGWLAACLRKTGQDKVATGAGSHTPPPRSCFSVQEKEPRDRIKDEKLMMCAIECNNIKSINQSTNTIFAPQRQNGTFFFPPFFLLFPIASFHLISSHLTSTRSFIVPSNPCCLAVLLTTLPSSSLRILISFLTRLGS